MAYCALYIPLSFDFALLCLFVIVSCTPWSGNDLHGPDNGVVGRNSLFWGRGGATVKPEVNYVVWRCRSELFLRQRRQLLDPPHPAGNFARTCCFAGTMVWDTTLLLARVRRRGGHLVLQLLV